MSENLTASEIREVAERVLAATSICAAKSAELVVARMLDSLLASSSALKQHAELMDARDENSRLQWELQQERRRLDVLKKQHNDLYEKSGLSGKDTESLFHALRKRAAEAEKALDSMKNQLERSVAENQSLTARAVSAVKETNTLKYQIRKLQKAAKQPSR